MNAQDQGPDESIRRQLQRLPQDLAPSRDLWNGIRADIETQASAVTSRRRAYTWSWVAAAGIAGLAVGVALTTLNLRDHAQLNVPAAATGGLMPVNVYAFAPPKADAARIALRRQVTANLDRLPVPTRDRVQRNLHEIETALADIQAALAQHPNDPLLQELLMTTYQNELDTLSNVEVLTRTTTTQVSL